MPGPLTAALPAQLRRMAQACGLEAVMTFIRVRGNTKLYVPQMPCPDGHELVIILGRKAADWLVANHGGETMIVPRAVEMLRLARNEEIWKLQDEGKSAAEIAKIYALHERQVWKILAERPQPDQADPVQSGLF